MAPTNKHLRLEDEQLLKGEGEFTDDLSLGGQGYAYFLRSDRANIEITNVDCEKARAMPGVRLALSALSPALESVKPFPNLGVMPGQKVLERPVMPIKVRHVGEIIAMIVADTAAQALDASEQIGWDAESFVPTVNEQAYAWSHGPKDEVAEILRQARWVAEVQATSNRIAPHYLEPRSALAAFDPERGRITLQTPSQGVHKIQHSICHALGLEKAQLRVVTKDVGGAFGAKMQAYPEQALVVLAAKLTGRPVKWTGSRMECSLMDAHGRAQELKARLALDKDGQFLALAVENQADLGAYATGFGSLTPSVSGAKVAGHAYKIPKICIDVSAHYSAKVPVDAYRGAGKPEFVYILERAINQAAALLQIDPVELRRRNLLSTGDMPSALPLGQEVDDADFKAILDRLINHSDYENFAKRRLQSESKGWLRGFGLGFHMHATGGFTNETSRIEVAPDGEVNAWTGSQAGGQGHTTTFANLIASQLNIDPETVNVHQGDTDALADGGGTGGSSSLPIAGVNLRSTAIELRCKILNGAAQHLEAALDDLMIEQGHVLIAGTDRGISFGELASQSELSASREFQGNHETMPYGAYAAEVEIDKDTGVIELKTFVGIDDIGNVMEPLIAQGQIHGGIVQSIGQALCEEVIFDTEGQLLNATLMDYALPRADDICALRTSFFSNPTRSNDLGAKGAGELGPAGALAPIVMAAIDALADHGVRQIDMPLTSEKVWRAIHAKD